MMAKMLKENGQVIHLSTYQSLNEAELSDAGELAEQVGGRTRHMLTRQYYLRELKEQGIMSVRWKAGT